MSSTSSQELAASPSGLNEPECEPSPSVRSIPGAETSLANDGPVFPVSMMSWHSLAAMSEPSMSYAEDSLVRMPASDKPNGESASGLTAHELDSGERSSDWPLTYDRRSSFWRTCQASLVPDLEQFSGTWPRSGLMRNGVAYLHPRPASPIDGTGSALLPTPAARDFRDLSAGKAFLSQRKRHSPSLATKLLERGVHWTMLSTAYEVAMGFPSQWSAGESSRWATRLSRSKRKRSGEQS